MAEHHHMTEAERAEHDELATTYATLLCHDAGVNITVSFFPHSLFLDREFEPRFEGLQPPHQRFLSYPLR